jgi:hypothetical protein
MKQRFLPIVVFTFGIAAVALAQAPAPASPAEKESLTATRVDRMPPNIEAIVLPSGSVSMLVDVIDSFVEQKLDPEGREGLMPNVLFGPGTAEAMVPAQLQLRRVSPVQALALVAAASGCTLEPITSLLETAVAPSPQQGTFRPTPPPPIIGYRFMLPTAPTMGGGARSPVLKRETVPAPDVSFFGSATESGVGSGGLQFRSQIMERPVPLVNAAGYTPVLNPAVSPRERFVRIYALGTILRGSSSEMMEKQTSLKMLVAEAMDQASLEGEAPTLSFHTATLTLIAKGNESQHGIIEQIITALKENEEGATEGGFGGGR